MAGGTYWQKRESDRRKRDAFLAKFEPVVPEPPAYKAPIDPHEFLVHLQKQGPVPARQLYECMTRMLLGETPVDTFKWSQMRPNQQIAAASYYRGVFVTEELAAIKAHREQQIAAKREEEMLADRLGAW